MNAGDVPPVLFPALSLQLPLTVVLAVSGPAYVVALHDEMPEPPLSDPWKTTWTGWLYQPLLSGGRSKVMLLIVGPEPSYLIDTPPDAVLPALSVQLALADPPPPNVPELQDAIPERLSLPDALKPTGWLYQSPESGPRDSETWTEGGVRRT